MPLFTLSGNIYRIITLKSDLRKGTGISGLQNFLHYENCCTCNILSDLAADIIPDTLAPGPPDPCPARPSRSSRRSRSGSPRTVMVSAESYSVTAPSPSGRGVCVVQHPGLTLPAERGVRPGRVASATTATGRWKDFPKTVKSSTHATNEREMGPSLIDHPPLSSDRQ